MNATTTVYASGMSQPSELNGCDKFVYVPFGYVKTTSDEAPANLRYASTKVDDFAIAILHNTRAVHPYERLLVFQEKAKAKAPQMGCSRARGQRQGQGRANGCASGRARRQTPSCTNGCPCEAREGEAVVEWV